jgi:hypothetical protein
VHITTKFDENPVNGLGKEVENVIVDGRRTTDHPKSSADFSAELKTKQNNS